MVIQKEPRSRQVEGDTDETVIGASGYATPITVDDTRNMGIPFERDGVHEGVTVPVQEVAAVDASVESNDALENVDDIDHIDDDDDDDIEPTEGETGPEYEGETPAE